MLLLSAVVINVTALQAQSPPTIRPGFDVASVRHHKPDSGERRNSVVAYGAQGVTFGALSLSFIIGEAYEFPVGRIVIPDSLPKEVALGSLGDGYDIDAKAEQPVPKDQLRLMLQSLLADRFRLTLHREARTGQLYRLVVAKGGPKLAQSELGGGFSISPDTGGVAFHNAEMTRLAGYLS